MSEKTLLAIESSCDETGVAVVRIREGEAGQQPSVEVIADVVASSMEQHARFGGVVPEIASRAHLEALQPVSTAGPRACRPGAGSQYLHS